MNYPSERRKNTEKEKGSVPDRIAGQPNRFSMLE